MDENEQRSGQMARVAAHIAASLATSGLKGAAVAAAEETAPFFVKLTVGLIAFVLLILILVFAAIPSMFFGFAGSGNQDIAQMTQQAMALGGVYISLEAIEQMQVDAIVSEIVEEYEDDDITIDEVRVRSSFDSKDLNWFIAINSVACRQDLNAMGAEEVRSFCTARLSHERNLVEILTGEEPRTVLKVKITHLDPDEFMDDLDFDEEARTWAGALYEVLSGSGAIEDYADFYEQYRPNVGGSPSAPGGLHGSGYDNGIDISRFVSPNTKNNKDLAIYAIQAWENNWGYVWGTYGSVLTESLLSYKIQQYPYWVGQNADFIRSHWLNRRCTDCVGLIKGYGWLDVSTGAIRYATNGMPDYDANSMYRAGVNAGVSGRDYGPISTMPDIPGLAVHMDGHIGVYIGSGYVVQAANTSAGVIKTQLAGGGWTEWCKIPYINYLE